MIKLYLLFFLNISVSLFADEPYSWVHSVHTTMGVPFDGDTTDDYIIVRDQYVLSYNNNNGGPNWVAWELNRDWIGDVDRYKGLFITDESLPSNYFHATHEDYTRSGYDRGHIVMSKQRSKTEEDNISTFLMTNILPQTPDLNRGVWQKFEMYCLNLVRKEDKELFIYAGGIYHSDKRIGQGVAVPDSFFKIVYVFNREDKPYTKEKFEHIITVVIPNINGVRKDDWEDYEKDIKKIYLKYKFIKN